MRQTLMVVGLLLLSGTRSPAQVERVWLSHRANDPSKLVVNWTTKEPGDSTVRFGLSPGYGRVVRIDEMTTLHHVEIPLAEKGVTYHYSVSTGPQHSPDATLKGHPTNELRVAIVADWHDKPDLRAIARDDVHLLLTAGDNISDLWERCGPGRKDCIAPYCDLIDRYPDLFRSVPFMPVLGNHDREIRPRGDRPPAEAVYDVDATAFRRFFELPGEEWIWSFDVPDFDLRLVALDLNHIQDMGTTWQTCHPFGRGSLQYEWYRGLTADQSRKFVITVHNEKHSRISRQEGGTWGQMLGQGTLVVSGFGHFGERAEADNIVAYNTSLSGRGDRYPEPNSRFLVSADNYLLLTFVKDAAELTAELKGLDGKVLDRTRHRGRTGTGQEATRRAASPGASGRRAFKP